jgi:hypothetical protein
MKEKVDVQHFWRGSGCEKVPKDAQEQSKRREGICHLLMCEQIHSFTQSCDLKESNRITIRKSRSQKDDVNHQITTERQSRIEKSCARNLLKERYCSNRPFQLELGMISQQNEYGKLFEARRSPSPLRENLESVRKRL